MNTPKVNLVILVIEAIALSVVGSVALIQLLQGNAVSVEINQVIQIILSLILAHNTVTTASIQNKVDNGK